MMCPKCGNGMYCTNSRQRDLESIRYRSYGCKNCGEKIYTVETVIDTDLGRAAVNKIINERKTM